MGWRKMLAALRRPRGVPAVLLVALGVFLLGAAVGRDGPFGAITAAWIQALGSIGAILATGHFLARERNHAARQKLSALAGVVIIGLKLIEEAAPRLRETGTHEYMNAINAFDPGHYETALELLNGIPLHEVSSADLVVSLHNLKEALRRAKIEINTSRLHFAQAQGRRPVNLTMPVRVAGEVRAALEKAWADVGGE